MRHRFHSICPYFAMFPESFPETWIERLTRRGDVVLDPFCGRGTTPFQAVLMGRRAVASDVNDVAVCLTRAKTAAPRMNTVLARLRRLEWAYAPRRWLSKADAQPEFFQVGYARATLAQLLFLRDNLAWRRSRSDAMIAALALGSLHGEMDKSKSYFSNQMPRTISTKPAYSVRFWTTRNLVAPERDVFDILRQRARFRYESDPPSGDAIVLHRDMRELPWIAERLPSPVRCVITSPPYFDVTNFEEDQWLRLWFLGGPPRPTHGRVSRDDRYSLEDGYWRFIADMWRSLGSIVSPRGHVVVRIGSSRLPSDLLVQRLKACGQFSGRRVHLASSEISEIRNRQTDRFRPGSKGCKSEVDCHFQFRS